MLVLSLLIYYFYVLDRAILVCLSKRQHNLDNTKSKDALLKKLICLVAKNSQTSCRIC